MGVITAPSLLQVTVVAGPPVEVQVRVLDWLSYLRLATLGEPEIVEKLIMMIPNKQYKVALNAITHDQCTGC